MQEILAVSGVIPTKSSRSLRSMNLQPPLPPEESLLLYDLGHIVIYYPLQSSYYTTSYETINMSNTSSNWLGSEELDLMVDALSVQLYYLANEERLTGVLEEDEEVHCPHAECSEYCISKMENYLLGGNLCRQYLFGVLNLEELCQAMVNADLKKYLFEISNYLPGSVRNKFGLYETSDYGSDGSDGEGQS
ncbi:hypothetical protein NQ315_006581 [Exocentrus adspersus]|uniref:Uncharacterized protein n=1 Tax=Exocentrus adspersus TaxID=1586481 RepID=A0AAV8VG13_9CUCU|nr:hypothetical protein NQ315_006581 [Exocentrus adspersus]